MAARSGLDERQPTGQRLVRALGTALIAVGCVVAAALIALTVLARTDSNGVSRVAGHPVLTVLSDSMVPTFRAGDLLVDRPASGSAADLEVGDAITFTTGTDRHLITHRIVAVERTSGGIVYRTQGDANNAPDAAPVLPEQVVGVYSTRIPYAGYALHAAQSRQGMFLLIAIPALVLLLPVFAKWWRATGPESSQPAAAAPVEHTTEPAFAPVGIARGGTGGGTHRAQ